MVGFFVLRERLVREKIRREKVSQSDKSVKILMHQNNVVWFIYMQQNDVSRSGPFILKQRLRF